MYTLLLHPIHLHSFFKMAATPQIAPPEGFAPLGISEVRTHVQTLCDVLVQNYKNRYPNSSNDMEFEIEAGRKYYKINQVNDGYSGGVHAFIDKKTGDVFKPASWRGPAKIVRYNLLNPISREECFNRADWAGGYLYVR